MRSRVFCFTLLSTIAISVAVSLPAQAQRARVFVSVNGNDSNPCTALSPCRTFQAAHDAVQAGGEIDVLNTGGYGPVSINKSISIVNPGGVVASIANTGQIAISINAGQSDVISLRGLTLDGGGVGSMGIWFFAGGRLEIADCVVRNYTGSGLTVQSSVASTLKVTNSEFNDNHDRGILIVPTASVTVSGTLDHVGVYKNFVGLDIDGTSAPGGDMNLTVKDSVADNNAFGVFVNSNGVSTIRVMLVRNVVSNQGSEGIASVGSGAQVIVHESTIFHNAHAWVASSGGFIFSHGNNSVESNAADFGPVTAASALE